MSERESGISYCKEPVSAEEFQDILMRSGLSERRPADDLARLQAMIDKANLIVTARQETDGLLVGLARSLTDFSYACYLSDLAVDRAYQRQGIGEALIEHTRRHAGSQATCLLVSAPDAVGFYEKIGMPRCDRAFLYSRES